MRNGRILFFSAPCGFGKTAVANALLRKWRTLCLRADAPDFSLQGLPDEWDILLIDDFQLIQEKEQLQALCDLIRANPARRFVLLSRGVPPACMAAFQYTGLMTTLEPDDLLFDREDIRRYFADNKVPETESEISVIVKESLGCPLGVVITARQMFGGKPFSPELVARAYREVFTYRRFANVPELFVRLQPLPCLAEGKGLFVFLSRSSSGRNDVKFMTKIRAAKNTPIAKQKKAQYNKAKNTKAAAMRLLYGMVVSTV